MTTAVTGENHVQDGNGFAPVTAVIAAAQGRGTPPEVQELYHLQKTGRFDGQRLELPDRCILDLGTILSGYFAKKPTADERNLLRTIAIAVVGQNSAATSMHQVWEHQVHPRQAP